MTGPITPGQVRPSPTLPEPVDPQTRQAAEGFEALFLDYLFQAMRKTVPESEMDLENTATKLYRGMLDSEVAQTSARTQGIGLADQIVAYLQAGRYNLNRGDPGGSHEGR